MAKKSSVESAYDKGFSDGVILALQILTSGGDMGCPYYEELLKTAGDVEIYRRAESEGMLKLSGLHDYVRQEFHEPSRLLRAELAELAKEQGK